MPTITQDENGQVLMVAYSTKEALKKAFDSGNMTYFSRSRQELWTKGETSGHTQKLIRMRVDCDRDAVLATVKQSGAACHNDTYSCFGDRRFSLQELHEVLSERIASNDPNSYTASLTEDGLKAKILEEADEVVQAETRDEIIWEAADVLYFLTTLLAKNDISVDEVFAELARRRRK